MAKEEPPMRPICGTLLTIKHSLISISECFIGSKLPDVGNTKHREKNNEPDRLHEIPESQIEGTNKIIRVLKQTRL